MKEIFVFGSNQRGVHGKGAALYARQHHGAIYGQGEGLQGNSYAIPTKDKKIRTLALDEIEAGVKRFVQFAKDHPEMSFKVTPIGTGLAGCRHDEIAPMFAGVPDNCVMPDEWKDLIDADQT